MIQLEVCATSIQSALAAREGGAVRVEFCDNLAEGGTTPSSVQIRLLRQELQIQLYILIRPRGGDFLYDDLEFEIMKDEISMCGEIGCDGVVIGMLNEDGTIDKVRCRELVERAHRYKMGVTFHRAFDRSRDLYQSLEDVIDIGCERILTSGGEKTAQKGADVIRKLIRQAGERIIIQPGAGITEDNIARLVRSTGLKEFHGSFRGSFPSRMKYFSEEFNDMKSERYLFLTDKEKVRNAIRRANREAEL